MPRWPSGSSGAIRRGRAGDDITHATDSIEATDWQVIGKDNKAWMPWTFEGLGLGDALMFKAGKRHQPWPAWT